MSPLACMAQRALATIQSSSRSPYVLRTLPSSHVAYGPIDSGRLVWNRAATLKTTPHWLEGCSKAPNPQPAHQGTRKTSRDGSCTLSSAGTKDQASGMPCSFTAPASASTRISEPGAGPPGPPDRAVRLDSTIRSRHHDLIKHVLRLKARRRYRSACGEVAVLGLETLRDLCSFHLQSGDERSDRCADTSAPEPWKAEASLLLTDCTALAANAASFGVRAARTRLATRDVMHAVLERKEPGYAAVSAGRGKSREEPVASSEAESQTVGVFRQPQPCKDFRRPRFVLAFDGLKYVWNLGILLRCAGVMGVDGLFYTKGTADPFNWKTLELSRGLHCHLPYQYGSSSELLDLCKRHRLAPIVADVSGDPIESVRDKVTGYEGICCILGSESRGPSEHIRQCATKLSFPLVAYIDSLNVGIAGGLMLSSLRKFLSLSGNPNSASMAGGPL